MTDRSPRQLTFDLPLQASFDPEDFFVSACNEAAYAFLEAWPDWPQPAALLLGPAGSGKSHLAAVWAARSGAVTLGRARLSEAGIHDLADRPAVVLEDCDDPGDEALLFHLLNAMRERGAFLLMTAARPPELWELRTPDLLSRLRLAQRISIEEADEALLGALLVKFFVERQMVVDTAVVEYVRPRIERSAAAARSFVETLDREGLSRRRRITRAFVAEVLRGGDEDDPFLPL
jgi:chromosomal replication initiation ATPase DnaA